MGILISDIQRQPDNTLVALNVMKAEKVCGWLVCFTLKKMKIDYSDNLVRVTLLPGWVDPNSVTVSLITLPL